VGPAPGAAYHSGDGPIGGALAAWWITGGVWRVLGAHIVTSAAAADG